MSKYYLVIISIVSILLGVRLFSFINQYSVNLIFWDQWGFLKPVFDHASLWTLFTWQHGPHRQGIGLIFTKAWMELSGWNSRTDSFAIGSIIFLSMIFTLFLKKRLIGQWSITDIAIPLAILSLAQYETFIGTPNASHSAFPLLIAILICLSLTINNRLIRTILVLFLNFIAIFTGFGIFLGLITPLIFVIEIYQAIRSKLRNQIFLPITGLIISILSIYLFTVGYKFDPAVSCFSVSSEYLLKYSKFASIMEAKFIHVDYQSNKLIAILLGASILLALVVGLIISGKKVISKGLVKENQVNFTTTVLIGYSLLFCLNATIGRTCLGMSAAGSSRYMTLLSLGFIGLYLFLVGLKNSLWGNLSIILLIGLLCLNLIPFGTKDTKTIVNFYYSGKTNWKTCYLKTEDIQFCNQSTKFYIYPDTQNQSVIDGLSYLKKNRLNLFLDVPIQ